MKKKIKIAVLLLFINLCPDLRKVSWGRCQFAEPFWIAELPFLFSLHFLELPGKMGSLWGINSLYKRSQMSALCRMLLLKSEITSESSSGCQQRFQLYLKNSGSGSGHFPVPSEFPSGTVSVSQNISCHAEVNSKSIFWGSCCHQAKTPSDSSSQIFVANPELW